MVIYLKIKEGILKDEFISLDTLEVDFGNTTFYILTGYGGFAMCGALNVDVYNSEKMKDRRVICMRALGVHSLEELYEAKIAEVSSYALSLGITKEMRVSDAFKILAFK